MLRVGLTGGLATGKTFVAETLRELGCHVIQADLLGHEALLPAGGAYDAVVNLFGGAILDDEALIDRRKLAEVVFADDAKLALLNSLVHPVVAGREEEVMTRIAASEPRAIVVVEAAILIETGSYKRFQKLVVVSCRPEQQLERAIARGMPLEQARDRLRRQLPMEEKIQLADYVIDTSGTIADTVRQTTSVYESLKAQSI